MKENAGRPILTHPTTPEMSLDSWPTFSWRRFSGRVCLVQHARLRKGSCEYCHDASFVKPGIFLNAGAIIKLNAMREWDSEPGNSVFFFPAFPSAGHLVLYSDYRIGTGTILSPHCHLYPHHLNMTKCDFASPLHEPEPDLFWRLSQTGYQ